MGQNKKTKFNDDDYSIEFQCTESGTKAFTFQHRDYTTNSDKNGKKHSLFLHRDNSTNSDKNGISISKGTEV